MVAAVADLGAAAAAGGWGMPIGAPVHDARGEKVGTVVGAVPYGLVVERGRFLVRATLSGWRTSTGWGAAGGT